VLQQMAYKLFGSMDGITATRRATEISFHIYNTNWLRDEGRSRSISFKSSKTWDGAFGAQSLS
jgi:hypothetical protein